MIMVATAHAGADPALTTSPVPYRTTALFDEATIPIGFKRAHSTKAGVWGVIRMVEGRARLSFFDGTADQIVTRAEPALLKPEQLHMLEPMGAVQFRVEFYGREPRLG